MGRHFFIFLFLCFLLHLQQTKASTVPIGAITNPTTRIGREQKVAIQLAVEKFSDLSLLANVSDLNSTDPSPMSSYVQNLVQLGAKSIIAAGTVPQVFIAGTFGEGAKVPIVSMAASPFLSGNFLIQMSYPETAFVRCIADIVKSFNWRKVIAVYEDDVFGSVSSSALLLSNALDAIGSELEYSLTFQPSQMMSDSRTTVREQLNNTKSQLSTVYIILRISETLAPIIFEEAVSLGLMTKGYIWICGNDITTLLDSSFTPTFISKYMQGLVGIRSYINVTAPDYVNFQSTFQQRFKTEYEKSGESSFDPGVYALRAYDAVDAISLAAATPEKNNKSLVENLVATNFSGLSGLVRPTNGSLDEGARYSTFHILNVFGRSYREMGIWVDGNGFYENEEEFDPHQPSSEKLQSVVFWPGGPHTSPSGLRTLKVGVPASNVVWENFVSVQKIGNFNSCSGYCIDVFNATLSFLGYEVAYDCIAYDINVYDELVNKVYLGEVDIVVGDVTILANRSENVSFTKPYLSSGLAMLVPVEVDKYGWLPTKTFSLALWICILALLLYYIMLVLFHELVEQEVPDFQRSLMEQLGASLWIVCNGIFLNLDNRIRSYHTKIVIILWFFVAQLVLNSFTASLSSILVTQNLRPDADTMKIGCDGDSFVPNYLTSVLNYSAESIVNIYNGSEYKLAFENGTITAAYLEVPYLRVFLSQNDNYTVYGETQMLGGFGFVLPKGSPLASDMSEAILKLGENGTLRQLEKKWFPVSLSNYVAPDEDSNQSLGLSNYTYMFVISSCLAFLTILHRFYEAIRAILDQPAPLPPAPPVPPNNVDPYDGMADIPLHDDPENRGRVAEIELPDINRGRVANIEQPNVSRDRGDEIEDFPLHNRVVHEMEDGRVAEIAQPHVNRGRVAHIEQPHVPRGRVDEIEDFPLQNRVVHEMEDGRVAEIAIPQVNIGRVADIEQLHVPRGRVDEVEDWHLQNRVVHEMEDIDLHDGVHNIGYRPSELQNNDTRPNMSGPKKRIQHAATFSDVSTATRVLLSFLSFRPRHIQEIERQGLLDSAQHEFENSPNLGLQNNDHQPGSSSIGKRFQHAASSSNLLRTTRRPHRSQSLHTRKDLQDASHDAEDQYLLHGSHEGQEPASVVRKSDGESSLSGNLRRRPSFA